MAATTSKTRLLRLLAWAGLVLGAGLAYAHFCRLTGLAVPCLFHLVTGLQCPGCGATRMCLALLRLDFAAAWAANPGLLLLLPFLCVLLGRMGWRYVVRNKVRLTRGENALIWCMVGCLLLYGLLRNLPRFG